MNYLIRLRAHIKSYTLRAWRLFTPCGPVSPRATDSLTEKSLFSFYDKNGCVGLLGALHIVVGLEKYHDLLGKKSARA